MAGGGQHCWAVASHHSLPLNNSLSAYSSSFSADSQAVAAESRGGEQKKGFVSGPDTAERGGGGGGDTTGAGK